MTKKKIKVQKLEIRIEKIKENDFVSLTDIAKQSEKETRFLIMSWLKNRSTLEFLETWERLHNPDFIKGDQMVTFRDSYLQNRNILTPQTWISETNATGIISKSGRGGGTWAHSDIAMNFCYWLSPAFQVYMIKEFQRLKEEEAHRKSFEWHISKITTNIDEIRNLLDTIPGQLPEFNRLLKEKKPK
ncbi:MAG: KilA-N domain-containing protein [Bacteroidota bacterium]